jgi:hypothetical protein
VALKKFPKNVHKKYAVLVSTKDNIAIRRPAPTFQVRNDEAGFLRALREPLAPSAVKAFFVKASPIPLAPSLDTSDRFPYAD